MSDDKGRAIVAAARVLLAHFRPNDNLDGGPAYMVAAIPEAEFHTLAAAMLGEVSTFTARAWLEVAMRRVAREAEARILRVMAARIASGAVRAVPGKDIEETIREMLLEEANRRPTR